MRSIAKVSPESLTFQDLLNKGDFTHTNIAVVRGVPWIEDGKTVVAKVLKSKCNLLISYFI